MNAIVSAQPSPIKVNVVGEESLMLEENPVKETPLSGGQIRWIEIAAAPVPSEADTNDVGSISGEGIVITLRLEVDCYER